MKSVVVEPHARCYYFNCFVAQEAFKYHHDYIILGIEIFEKYIKLINHNLHSVLLIHSGNLLAFVTLLEKKIHSNPE